MNFPDDPPSLIPSPEASPAVENDQAEAQFHKTIYWRIGGSQEKAALEQGIVGPNI
jgi:hypothetical protein